MKDKRIVFMGTPEFSVPVLEMLIKNYNVVGVVTQPDKEVGRKKEIVFSPVKKLAIENLIPVLQPSKVRDDYDSIVALEPSIIITCAYGQIIPKELLEYPEFGCINVHASLLPSLRGGAPIHHSLLEDFENTGVTIMYMAEGMDTGDILFQAKTVISDDDTFETLYKRLSIMGTALLESSLPLIFKGEVSPVVQDPSLVTYGYNIKREEELVTFNRNTRVVFNHIRGLSPFPGAYAILDGVVIKLFSSRFGSLKPSMPGKIIAVYPDGFGVSTQDGEIIITVIQVSGKKKMLARDYFNGVIKNDFIGKIFNKE